MFCALGGGWGTLDILGVYRWDSDTLILYQTMFSCIFLPYSRLDVKNSNPIPDVLSPGLGFLKGD